MAELLVLVCAADAFCFTVGQRAENLAQVGATFKGAPQVSTSASQAPPPKCSSLSKKFHQLGSRCSKTQDWGISDSNCTKEKRGLKMEASHEGVQCPGKHGLLHFSKCIGLTL